MIPTGRPAVPRIRLPLHIHPHDWTPRACRKRYGLHLLMAQINPNGFRKPRTSRKRANAQPQLFTYGDMLASMANMKEAT